MNKEYHKRQAVLRPINLYKTGTMFQLRFIVMANLESVQKPILFVLLLVAFFLCVTPYSYGQKILSRIDTLKTDDDLKQLLCSIDSYFERFTPKPTIVHDQDRRRRRLCRKTADSLNIHASFHKADFDNNGYTDLLVTGIYYGFQTFVFMNYGNDSIIADNLSARMNLQGTFLKILNDTIIRYYYMSPQYSRYKNDPIRISFTDLVYKFGGFIERGEQSRGYAIERVDFQTTKCYGTCPQFRISVNKDRSALFIAELHNKDRSRVNEVKGTFYTTVSESALAEVTGLLNYMNFPALRSYYAVNWTDAPTSTLTIVYDNGQVKRITDYGLKGTFGLHRVYELFFMLRFNQDWQ